MRVAIGCDHAGLTLKQEIARLLNELGHEYRDFGCHTTDSVDYPDIAGDVARAVAEGEFEQGILICGTGIGMSMAANKVAGIRAALCHDGFCARRAREHNDANILCLGEGVTGKELAKDIVRNYLGAQFEAGRHARRVSKIQGLEER